MSLAPCYSRPLTIWMKNAFQRGHARIPSITNVDVDYDNEVLTVNVQNYTETVWIYIYDINGNIIDSAASQITGEGTVTLNVQDFPEGVCKSSLAIDSQGNIYKCLEHLGAPNNKVGDLKSGTMSLAKLSHAMFAQNPFHSAECLHCNILPICGGGCPIDREKYIGKDKRFCSIYKENLSELLPYFYTYKYSK